MGAEEPKLYLGEVLKAVARHWKAILVCGAIGMAAGIILSLALPRQFSSDATISMKQNQGGDGASSLLTKLGGLGGSVASQLMGSSGSLDKVEILLRSRQLAELVVGRTNITNKVLAWKWDKKKSAWREGEEPSPLEAADYIRTHMLRTKFDNKKQIIVVSITSRDSSLAKPLVEAYLTELNEKLRNNIAEDADSNRSYMERSLTQTIDPMLREKISNIIANEMERSLLLRNSMIDVLEKPYSPKGSSKPNRRLIVFSLTLIGLALGTVLAGVRVMWGNLEGMA